MLDIPNSLSLHPAKGRSSTHRVGGVDQFAWLAELDQTLLQVGQGALHQTLLLLVVGQQMVPQGLLQHNSLGQ